MRGLFGLFFVLGSLIFAATLHSEESAFVQSSQVSEMDVKTPLSELTQRTEEVLKSMGIHITSKKTEDAGAKQVIQGRRGENTVEVELTQRSAGVTHIGVTAKKGLVASNPDLAQQVIERIIRAS